MTTLRSGCSIGLGRRPGRVRARERDDEERHEGGQHGWASEHEILLVRDFLSDSDGHGNDWPRRVKVSGRHNGAPVVTGRDPHDDLLSSSA
jgi:hypothetical protein